MDASCLNLNPLDMDWLSCVNSQRRKLLFILSHVTEYLSYVCNQLFPRVSPCITMSKNDFDIINVKNHVNTWIVWESDSFANKGVDSFLYKKKNFRGFLHWEFPRNLLCTWLSVLKSLMNRHGKISYLGSFTFLKTANHRSFYSKSYSKE